MNAPDAAFSRETSTVEIPGSPLSRHDLDVISREIARSCLSGFRPDEIVVSSRRVREGLRAFGLSVRLNDDVGLHDGLLVARDREPIAFSFEDDRG
jgi:hypothetical protein